MSKLTSAMLKFEFLDVTGYEERIGDNIARISINTEGMAFGIENNVCCIVDDNGHTWIRPNIFKNQKDKTEMALIKKLARTNKSCAVPFSRDSNRFVRQVWPHLFN